jgi:hypothetical protein
MRTLLFAASLCAAVLLAGAANAQAPGSVRFDLPIVLPTPVDLQPGVGVLPLLDEEIFVVDGWYWARREPRWYRTRDHLAGWVEVDRRTVPGALLKLPPGRFKNYWKGKFDEKPAEPAPEAGKPAG